MNQDTVRAYLEEEPRARERRNKDRALVNLLIRKYPQLSCIEKSTLTEIVLDYNNADRYWRKTLHEYPHLRGKDYGTKDIVEQRKELALGYEVGYSIDVKR